MDQPPRNPVLPKRHFIRLGQPPGLAQDSLQRGTLDETQAEAVRSLRSGLLRLAERETSVVKVPKDAE